MSTLGPPRKVKLFFSVFARSAPVLTEALAYLASRYGRFDYETPPFPFTQTGYYADEFGTDLFRVIVACETLIEPDQIIAVKQDAVRYEEATSADGKRIVNIDPGYLELSRMVLTTGKDYAHRIYLGGGVYADLHLLYTNKEGFVPLPWTYPDYASNEYRMSFEEIRRKLKAQTRS